MKKIIALVVLIFIIQLPFSCDPYSSSGYYRYTVDSIAVTAGVYDGSFVPVDQLEDPLSVSALTLRLMITDYTAVEISQANPFTTTCLADPAPPNLAVDEIIVTSDISLVLDGVSYGASTTLNDIIDVFDGSQHRRPLNEYLTCCSTWYIYEPVYLAFSGQLAEAVQPKFIVEITFDDGSAFNIETSKINLVP